MNKSTKDIRENTKDKIPCEFCGKLCKEIKQYSIMPNQDGDKNAIIHLCSKCNAAFHFILEFDPHNYHSLCKEVMKTIKKELPKDAIRPFNKLTQASKKGDVNVRKYLYKSFKAKYKKAIYNFPKK